MTMHNRGNSFFQRVYAQIVERRNLAVLLRRKPLQPGLARVHDQHLDAGRDHLLREMLQVVR